MFSRPSIQTLVNRAVADVQSRMSVEELLRRNDAAVLAIAVAGLTHGLYGKLDSDAKELFTDTASVKGLAREASLWLENPAIDAAAASGNIDITGTTGRVVPVGSELVRSNGLIYTTTAEVTLAAGSATVAIQCNSAGLNTNAVEGETLTLMTPIDGINSTVTVAVGGLVGGADAEDPEQLRARIKARKKEPAHGGSKNDYVTWAKEVAGVTRAWVYPNELGAGTVTVRFVRDGDANLIPDAGEVATVQAYIDDASRRPVTAQLTAAAPSAVPQNYTITVSPNTAAVKAAVTASLADMLRRKAVPHGGEHDGTIYLDDNREAVKTATGLQHYTMSFPAGDVALTTGQLAVMGVITWG